MTHDLLQLSGQHASTCRRTWSGSRWVRPARGLSISITRGAQKPPWQRPMPARVRRFTPSTERRAAVNRLDDLGLGHGLAAADYAAVERVVAMYAAARSSRVHAAEGLGVFACMGLQSALALRVSSARFAQQVRAHTRRWPARWTGRASRCPRRV